MVRQRLAELTELTSSGAVLPLSLPTAIAGVISRYQVAYGILLALASSFNGMLRAFDPGDMTLVEESVSFSNEIMTIAAHASQYRPLGAAHIPLCLIAAWATTVDPFKRAEMEKMLADYQKDFGAPRWGQFALWLKNNFDSLNRKVSRSHHETSRDVGSTAASAPSGDLPNAKGAGASCCIM